MNRIKFFYFYTVFILSAFPALRSSASSWSNYFRFVNNFNTPLILKVDAGIETISAFSVSKEYELSTNWLGENNGSITISRVDDLSSTCIFQYNYSFENSMLSYFATRSEVFSPANCTGKLQAKEFSLVNSSTQYAVRPIAALFPKVTDVLSHADCGALGGDNCIVASPDFTTQYIENGSTLQQALQLQTTIAQFEPLNVGQILGAHNAAISPQYTTNKSDIFNLSYGDPDNYLSLTDQLNSGVRQIELDISWYNENVIVCHNHVNSILEPLLCTGNPPLFSTDIHVKTPLQEIKNWISKNPDAFLFVYLDVNLPLTGHVQDLDTALAGLDPYVYKPQMSADGDNLPLQPFSLTPYEMTHQFHKNIIITNDNDIENLKKSQYAFVSVLNSASAPLPEHGIDDLIKTKYSCTDPSNKYSNIQNFYSDNGHNNIWRLNGDRTILGNINTNDDDNGYSAEFYTSQNSKKVLACPINIFSTNMLGYTCDSSSCIFNPTDSRFYSFLWSWNLGYPLTSGGEDIAYINQSNGHFENSDLNLTQDKVFALCSAAHPNQQNVTALTWFAIPVTLTGETNKHDIAVQACMGANGKFSVPTTAYWLNDVMQMIYNEGINSSKIIVNYTFMNNTWITNDGQSL